MRSKCIKFLLKFEFLLNILFCVSYFSALSSHRHRVVHNRIELCTEHIQFKEMVYYILVQVSTRCLLEPVVESINVVSNP